MYLLLKRPDQAENIPELIFKSRVKLKSKQSFEKIGRLRSWVTALLNRKQVQNANELAQNGKVSDNLMIQS